MNELTALQNFANTLKLEVKQVFIEDKRKTVKMYCATKDGTSVSPTLDYKEMNNFFIGWMGSLKNNQLKEENKKMKDLLQLVSDSHDNYSPYLGMTQGIFYKIDELLNDLNKKK